MRICAVLSCIVVHAFAVALHESPERIAHIRDASQSYAVQNAKRDVDIAKAQDATAEVKRLANKQIGKQETTAAALERTKVDHFKERFFKDKGRAAADKVMTTKLLAMKAQEHQAKFGKVGKLKTKELAGKQELADHKHALKAIRTATKLAMLHAEQKGVKPLKVNKLKTHEKLVKIRNKKISSEMDADEQAIAHARAVHHDHRASKQQKLQAMKGEVKGLMFLKALDKKATGALATVNDLKKTLAQRKHAGVSDTVRMLAD